MPYQYVGALVDLRVTNTMLEAYLGGDRLCSHVLAPLGVVNEYRTHDSDLPEGPRYQEWDPERVRAWAVRIGENTTTVVTRIFESVPIAEQGLDPALAVLRLSRHYSSQRLEKACELALAGPLPSPRYAHLRPILESRQDETGGPTPLAASGTPSGYVRGAAYYGGETK